jgi:hypothetical protein
MDDDEDREFSKEIVYGFFDQAESTFVKMDHAMYVLFKLFGQGLPLGTLGHSRLYSNFVDKSANILPPHKL